MKKLLVIFFVISLIISSCNMPLENNSTDPAVATAAALTVQAALNAPLATSPAGTDSGNVATPTYSKPVITVSDVTNCRTGPGVNYERVTQIQPNEQVEVIGVYPPSYWIVSTNAGVCWVNAEFATTSGSVNVVPTVTAPATPEGNSPDRVSLQKWDIFCNYQTGLADVSIRWADADSEEGYRVERNGTIIAELPANVTQFTESINMGAGQSVGYRVIAFNTIGDTISSNIALYC